MSSDELETRGAEDTTSERLPHLKVVFNVVNKNKKKGQPGKKCLFPLNDIKFFHGSEPGQETYSSGNNRVQVFRVPVAEGHKIGIEGSDAL